LGKKAVVIYKTKKRPSNLLIVIYETTSWNNFLICFSLADGRHPFPLVMVGKVLEANKKWDIGKEVIDCVTKNYPGAYPIHPKVSRI
jgi:hypothetical protein